MVSSSHSYKTEHSQWYQCLAENSASEIERGGTDNEGDDGGTGYINIRFAKLLHFTWHEFCIEAKFTLRASSFSPKSQSGHNLCLHNIHESLLFIIFDFSQLHDKLGVALHPCAEHLVRSCLGTAPEVASNKNP